ncbi:uncharacterized protein TRAVEDRAFT_48173 [Trametes versicolor FP-101664 SS1]|uniref:uncharacterized protein n=1 Tax=Trametes versicolor (strain FP-101664) TaxID=717944 RepID=UPI00046228CD|nr:uncharacterized protein TRAVEDRAFT_48173 [Trametes versicolor FP-101664 SS1]EIW57120.1 hypothetical protein TRAVEDRAFT_48173 [Trametes versicolor FP-101664 SS1]
MSQRSQTAPPDSTADVTASEMPDKPGVRSPLTHTPPVSTSPPASGLCIEDNMQVNKKTLHESLTAGLSGMPPNNDYTYEYGWNTCESPSDGPTRQNSRDSALPALANTRPSTFGPVPSPPVHSPTHQDSKDSDDAGVGLASRDSALSAIRSSTFGPVHSGEGEVPAQALANVVPESPSDIQQRGELAT